MTGTKIKSLAGQIALIAAGVLVANQVQKLLDKSRIIKPTSA